MGAENAVKAVFEPGREIPVLDEVDVLVAGAGVSGCSAAVSAWRAGARTMLVERNGVLGGVATAGLMSNIVNKFLNVRGERIVGGFPLEVVQRMAALGAAAAVAVQSRCTCREVDIRKVQLVLREQDVFLGA